MSAWIHAKVFMHLFNSGLVGATDVYILRNQTFIGNTVQCKYVCVIAIFYSVFSLPKSINIVVVRTKLTSLA